LILNQDLLLRRHKPLNLASEFRLGNRFRGHRAEWHHMLQLGNIRPLFTSGRERCDNPAAPAAVPQAAGLAGGWPADGLWMEG
jgi:hypothetical protein